MTGRMTPSERIAANLAEIHDVIKSAETDRERALIDLVIECTLNECWRIVRLSREEKVKG
jgi:hypothetical protein